MENSMCCAAGEYGVIVESSTKPMFCSAGLFFFHQNCEIIDGLIQALSQGLAHSALKREGASTTLWSDPDCLKTVIPFMK
jgi:hypothetical protein